MDTCDYLGKQACRDLKAADILCKSECFGIAAYLYQQALEKKIKSVVIECKLVECDIRELLHLPLTKLWKNISDHHEKQAEKSKDDKNIHHELNTIFEAIRKFFEHIKKDDNRRSWWKLSLNYKSEEYEKEIKEQYDKILHKEVNVLRDAAISFLKSNEFFDKNSRNKEMLKNLVGDLKKMNYDSLEDFAAFLTEVLKKIESAIYKKRNERNNMGLDDKQHRDIVMLWVCGHFKLVLEMFPHEELGRYPEKIDKKSSLDIYSEQGKNVKYLGCEIKQAFKQLDNLLSWVRGYRHKKHK